MYSNTFIIAIRDEDYYSIMAPVESNNLWTASHIDPVLGNALFTGNLSMEPGQLSGDLGNNRYLATTIMIGDKYYYRLRYTCHDQYDCCDRYEATLRVNGTLLAKLDYDSVDLDQTIDIPAKESSIEITSITGR